MNKAYLDRFISKYSLGDSVNSVVLNVNNEVFTWKGYFRYFSV